MSISHITELVGRPEVAQMLGVISQKSCFCTVGVPYIVRFRRGLACWNRAANFHDFPRWRSKPEVVCYCIFLRRRLGFWAAFDFHNLVLFELVEKARLAIIGKFVFRSYLRCLSSDFDAVWLVATGKTKRTLPLVEIAD
jgi:hypothetical protein